MMKGDAMLELHASFEQTHQSWPGFMVFPQFTKIPVTLVFNKTNNLIKSQKWTKYKMYIKWNSSGTLMQMVQSD